MQRANAQNHQNGEAFHQLHPSFMAKTNIRREKEKNIAAREQEIRTSITKKIDEGKKLNDKNNATNPSTFNNNNMNIRNRGNNMNKKETFNKESKNNVEEVEELNTNSLLDSKNNDKHIKLAVNQERFSIGEELNSTLCNITLGQLLDISPKIRSELSKLLKIEKNSIVSATSNLNPSITLVNNISHNYESHSKEITEDELAMVTATVEYKPARLLIDTCSNINVITSEFQAKLKNYKKVGFCSSRIRQAAVDCDPNKNLLVQLPLTIGHLTISLTFRVIENSDMFYDLLIGLKAQADNRLIVIPYKKILVHSLEDGSYDTLAVLNQNIPEEKYICFIEKVNDNKFNENGDSTVCAVNNITKPPYNSPDLPPTSSNILPLTTFLQLNIFTLQNSSTILMKNTLLIWYRCWKIIWKSWLPLQKSYRLLY